MPFLSCKFFGCVSLLFESGGLCRSGYVSHVNKHLHIKYDRNKVIAESYQCVMSRVLMGCGVNR